MELVDGRDLRDTLRLGPIGPADAAGHARRPRRGAARHPRARHRAPRREAGERAPRARAPAEPHAGTRSSPTSASPASSTTPASPRTGLLVGTPGYLSPEQVSGHPPTPAADVYALGLLVLEARTGETAFPGPAVESAGARLVRDPDIPESLGADWVALLRAMTARNAGGPPVGDRRRGRGHRARHLVRGSRRARPRRRSPSPGSPRRPRSPSTEHAASDDARPRRDRRHRTGGRRDAAGRSRGREARCRGIR